MFLDDPAEPRVAEEIALGVHRLGDAVRVEDDHVARVRGEICFSSSSSSNFSAAPSMRRPEDHAARDEDLRALQRRGGPGR